MKTVQKSFIPFFVCLFWIFPLLAQESSEILNQFQWHQTTATLQKRTKQSARINRYQIEYPADLSRYAQNFTTMLTALDIYLSKSFQLRSGQYQIAIQLEDAATYQNKQVQVVQSVKRFVFPYFINTQQPAIDFASFSMFNLVHAIIKSHLVFGNDKRITISSHAFRFADGLSGFLALDFLNQQYQMNKNQVLAYLDLQYIQKETQRRFSPSQMLSQNASSEETDSFAGYGQFLNGITLNKNSQIMMELRDQTSTADRIRVFSYIHQQHTPKAITQIIDRLKKTNLLWPYQPETTDSFCRKYVRVGCESSSLDGTRSDIILKTITNKKYAELLAESKQILVNQSGVQTQFVPETGSYLINFPKAGGSSENLTEISLIAGQHTIQKNDVLEETSVNQTGFRLSFGFKDDVYLSRFLIQYTWGETERDDEFSYQNNTYKAPQTIEQAELLIGFMIGDNGKLDHWGHEMAMLFHWIRIRSEWDMKKVNTGNTDLEFINRGYFLADWQNYSFLKVSSHMDIGLNYHLQTGLVSHSGSTKIARKEKYNKDTATWILGATLGPELRFPFDHINLNIRVGADYSHLWQPFDEESGKSSEGKINSSQSLTRAYAAISYQF